MAETNKEKERNYGAGVPKVRLDYTDPMLLLEVEGFARDGYSDEQIAEIYGVNHDTFSKNKRKKRTLENGEKAQSLLSQALTKGRRPLSVLVENAMYTAAVGGKKVITTITKHILTPEGEKTDFQEVMVTETELAPNVAAQMNWLKHHKPDMYNPVVMVQNDLTTNGKDLNALPMIGKIEHVIISSDNVKKFDADTEDPPAE